MVLCNPLFERRLREWYGTADEQTKCIVQVAEKIDTPHTRRLEQIGAAVDRGAERWTVTPPCGCSPNARWPWRKCPPKIPFRAWPIPSS